MSAHGDLSISEDAEVGDRMAELLAVHATEFVNEQLEKCRKFESYGSLVLLSCSWARGTAEFA